jgi:hypothetical protein
MGRYLAMRRRRQGLRVLQNCDDHLLDDLGLGRQTLVGKRPPLMAPEMREALRHVRFADRLVGMAWQAQYH